MIDVTPMKQLRVPNMVNGSPLNGSLVLLGAFTTSGQCYTDPHERHGKQHNENIIISTDAYRTPEDMGRERWRERRRGGGTLSLK